MYLKRQLEKTIKSMNKQFACVTVFGARQVGKSTMLRETFPSFKYISLDNDSDRMLAQENPKLFLDNYKWPIIIDEIQKAPELFEQIKISIDEQKYIWMKNNKKTEFMYILSGSNQFELQEKTTESLAGRTAVLNLSSLSNIEKNNIEGSIFKPDINVLKRKSSKLIYKNRYEVFEEIFAGGMPEYYLNDIDRNAFFDSYISTYLEKDVKQLIEVKKVNDFKKFLTYIALRTAQQLNLEDIASSIGVDYRTVKRWISILESSGIIVFLQPYMSNVSNRIIKSPKLYFMDTGLCAYLCGWQDWNMLEKSSMSGAFYETYVVSEIVKSFYNEGRKIDYTLYYYRDRDSKEIDILYVENNVIYPIEIKKGQNKTKANKNFSVLNKYNMEIGTGLIIDTSDKLFPLNENVYFCPVGMIGI